MHNNNDKCIQEKKRQKTFHNHEVHHIPMEICNDLPLLSNGLDQNERRRLFTEETQPHALLPPPTVLRAQYTSWIGENGLIVYNSANGNRYYDEDTDYDNVFDEEQDDIITFFQNS